MLLPAEMLASSTGRNQPPWYVVYCQPFKERQAAHILQSELDLVVYLPEIDAGHLYSETTLLFPRYLFVQFDFVTTPLHSIKVIPAIIGPVSYGNVAQKISEDVITDLRTFVHQLNTAYLSTNTFRPGETVRISAGVFEGLEAIFVKQLHAEERVYVLMSFLGGLREIELDVEVIEPVDRHINRPRRTRGRGRLIKQKVA